MEFENYTERARGFIQSAQTLALRENHQQLTPLHLLKGLLDDKEGLGVNLINAAGGDGAGALSRTEAELAKLPTVEGASAGQVYLAPETARLFEQAEQIIHGLSGPSVGVEPKASAKRRSPGKPSPSESWTSSSVSGLSPFTG